MKIFIRRLRVLRSGPAGWVFCLVAGAFLLSGCESPGRSFAALDAQAPVPVTGLSEAVGDESEKLAQEYDALRARLDRQVAPERAAHPVAPPYDPLENETISVNMHDTGVDRLLWILSEHSNMNLVVDPEVLEQGIRTSLMLKNVTARELYNHILETFDLSGEVKGGALYINVYEERLFNASFLRANLSVNLASGGDVFGSNSSGGGGSSNTLRADFSITSSAERPVDIYDEFENAVKNILGLGDGAATPQARQRTDANGRPLRGGAVEAPPMRYNLDRANGTLYVRARPSQIRAIHRLIELNRRISRRQLLVEAQVIDVQLNDDYQFGVDWTLLRRNVAGIYGGDSLRILEHSTAFPDALPKGLRPDGILPDGTFPENTLLGRTLTVPAQAIGGLGSSSLGLSYNDERFSATIKALSSFGTLRVLSNPSVRVRNGTPALLSVGANIRYISKSSSTVNNVGGTATTSSDVETDSLFSGVVVGVVPHILENGRIELLVHPIQTDVAAASLQLVDVGNGNVVTLPRINYKGLTTTLNLG
ncbi:MAG: hypothetical protein LBJ46_02160, partial [Planctomycetota bacterium]|nr:hypothetical protein [Planctomycetota bacterium]